MTGLIKRKRSDDFDEELQTENRRNRRWKADMEEDMERLNRNVTSQLTDMKDMMRNFFMVGCVCVAVTMTSNNNHCGRVVRAILVHRLHPEVVWAFKWAAVRSDMECRFILVLACFRHLCHLLLSLRQLAAKRRLLLLLPVATDVVFALNSLILFFVRRSLHHFFSFSPFLLLRALSRF